MRKYSLPIVVSVIVAFLFTMVFAYGSTTISTNITTGGTLTVSGNSTLSGNSTFGDASTDVNLFTGTLQASTTALFTGNVTLYGTTTVNSGITLVLGGSTSNLNGASAGAIYYNSTAGEVRLYNGSSWGVIGTTTGFTLSGKSIRLATPANQYLSIGTTTVSDASLVTLEATSTLAIPLTLKGYTSQSANLFQVQNVGGTELFAIDASGHASSTGAWTIAGTVYGNGDMVLGDSTGRDQITGYGFFTVGTTTQKGLSTLTLAASSSASIPLSIMAAEDSQTADLFQVYGVNQTELFAIDASGHASSTGAWTIGGTLGVGTSTPLGDFAIEQTVGLSAFTVGSSTLNSYLMNIDANGDLTYDGTDFVIDRSASFVGIGTSTPRSALSIGTAAATTTVSAGRLCITTELNNGSMLYMWPCSGGDGCAAGQAWATSTTDSCE